MKICKARVMQCSGPMFWYRALVGKEVFTIRQHGDSDLGFLMIFIGAFYSTPPTASYFSEKDLEIIEEFDGDIVERVTIDVVRKVGSDNTAAIMVSNGEVRGAGGFAGEASSAEGATSTVVLGAGDDK